MAKYTEEQLFDLQSSAHVPQPTILEAFNNLVELVREHAAAEHEKRIKWNNGDTYIDENGNERPYHHMNRRKLSRSGGNRPNLRKKSAAEVQVDEDGWATLAPKTKKSFGAEEGVDERNKFRESFKETVKAKPNNKNLGSSKAVDPREIADGHKRVFNAFEALGDDE